MLKNSQITFSLGQPPKVEDTTELARGAAPVYEYVPKLPTIAAQVTDTFGTMSPNEPASQSTIAVPSTDIKIPTGAILRQPMAIRLGKRVPRLETRQLWEGTVIRVLNDTFVAILKDKTESKNPDEQVTFEFSEISREDRPLVKPGSSFYWTIGSKRTAGQLENVSIVQFRRLPVWTRNALVNAETRARKVRDVFRSQE
jgi:hypothetical protein